MIPELTPAEIVRFYSKLQIGGCGLVWAGGELNSHGYGRFRIYRSGKTIRILAHRLSYKLATGEEPASPVLRHGCDIPLCCTPDCLTPGTHVENARDMLERGRANMTGLEIGRARQEEDFRARLAANEKHCSGCGITKNLDDFSRNATSPDGRQGWCRLCDNSRPSGRSSLNAPKPVRT